MAARGLIDYSDSDEESSEQSAPVVGLREPSQLPISEELTGSASAVCEVAHASPRSRSRLGDSGDDSENLKLDASSQAEPASVAVTDRSHHIDTEVDGAAGPGRSVLGTKRRRLDALPPSADEDAPPAVVQRFQEYLRLSAAGHNFTSVLRRKKDFGNPCILDKVIQHYGIDHIGECRRGGWASVAARRAMCRTAGSALVGRGSRSRSVVILAEGVAAGAQSTTFASPLPSPRLQARHTHLLSWTLTATRLASTIGRWQRRSGERRRSEPRGRALLCAAPSRSRRRAPRRQGQLLEAP